jgi:hypothetical protein
MRSAVEASCALLVIIIRLVVCEPGPSGLEERAIVTILFRSQNGSGHDRNRPRVGMVRQGPGCINGMGGAEYRSPTCVCRTLECWNRAIPRVPRDTQCSWELTRHLVYGNQQGIWSLYQHFSAARRFGPVLPLQHGCDR